MALAIADFMADGQVFCVAVAAVAQCLNVFQRRGLERDMFAANPARHDAMELSRDCFIHLDPKVSQTAHDGIFMQNKAGFRPGLLKGVRDLAFDLPDAACLPTIPDSKLPRIPHERRRTSHCLPAGPA
jgi:hypothetical protein